MAATQRRQNRAQSRPVRKVTPPRLPQHGRWTKGQGHAEAGSEDGIPAEGRAGVEADQGGNVTPGKGRHGRERKNGKGHAEARARQRGHGQRRTRLATETPRARIQGKGRAYAEENLWPSQAQDAPTPGAGAGRLLQSPRGRGSSPVFAMQDLADAGPPGTCRCETGAGSCHAETQPPQGRGNAGPC